MFIRQFIPPAGGDTIFRIDFGVTLPVGIWMESYLNSPLRGPGEAAGGGGNAGFRSDRYVQRSPEVVAPGKGKGGTVTWGSRVSWHKDEGPGR